MTQGASYVPQVTLQAPTTNSDVGGKHVQTRACAHLVYPVSYSMLIVCIRAYGCMYGCTANPPTANPPTDFRGLDSSII